MIGSRNTFVETLTRWVRCAFGNVLSIHVVVRSKTASNSNWPFCFAEWVGIPKKSWPGLTNISWLQLGVQSVLSCILDTVGQWWTLLDQAYIGTSSVHQSCRTLAIVSTPGKCHNTNLSACKLQLLGVQRITQNNLESYFVLFVCLTTDVKFGGQKVETIRILLFCLSTPPAKASAAGFNETVKSGPAGSLTMDLTLKLPCSPKPA